MQDGSAYKEEGGWVAWLLPLLAIFIVLAIVLTKKKKDKSSEKESGYEPDEIYGGMKVLKLDCAKDKIPTKKELPPNTLVQCITNWEWMEREFHKFYTARENLEKAKKTRNFDAIQAAENQVIEQGWEMDRAIAIMDQVL